MFELCLRTMIRLGILESRSRFRRRLLRIPAGCNLTLLWPMKCRQRAKTNKSNCQFWKNSTYDWLGDNPSRDQFGKTPRDHRKSREHQDRPNAEATLSLPCTQEKACLEFPHPHPPPHLSSTWQLFTPVPVGQALKSLPMDGDVARREKRDAYRRLCLWHSEEHAT
jgi:hypothetical protein